MSIGWRPAAAREDRELKRAGRDAKNGVARRVRNVKHAVWAEDERRRLRERRVCLGVH